MSSPFALFPERASTMAWSVDALFLFILWISIFFTVGISAAVVYFAIKYRRKHDDEVPVQIEGHLGLEILWSVIPLILMMVMFFWGTKVFLQLVANPADATPIYVVGKQWMWKIQHPDGRREINELHVPVGEKFRLIMTSEDVLHSFFVPAFRTKMDVVPGRYSSLWFEATREGVYHLFCAEYCGTSHSGMTGRVVVMSPADYAKWLSGQAPAGPAGGAMADVGAQLFTAKACNTCHDGRPGALGPPLAGTFGHSVTLADGSEVVVDEGYIRESILNPQAKLVRGFQPVMPTYKGQLSEEEILQLITHIKSLKSVEASGEKP